MVPWQDRLYLGTWQLGGDFSRQVYERRELLIQQAWRAGVKRFDTAAVYGRGKVEESLGNILPIEAHIVTKIPAVRKPEANPTDQAGNLYPKEWLKRQLAFSQNRLGRIPSTVLLHNWARCWKSGDDLTPLEFLKEQKDRGQLGRFGISLPDGFGVIPSNEVLEIIDVLEVPANSSETWVFPWIGTLLACGVEVLIRSIFLQGTLLKNSNQWEAMDQCDIRHKKYSPQQVINPQRPENLLREAWGRNTSVVIGMTSIEQLNQNIAVVREGEYDAKE